MIEPFRAPPPAAESLLAWPDDFGTRFCVFVDTEEEFDWTVPLARASRSTTHMAALPAAHARFADAGVPLTYLIDHPIATCTASTDILNRLLEDGRSAIGTQLHPWVNPPFDEPVTGPNSFTGNLPRALEAAKLETLTDAIAGAFGKRPVLYRAGRYGVGRNSFAELERLGYRVDTSMRSGYDYSGELGPDFTAVPNQAFRIGGLVELPLTTMFLGHLRGGGARLFRDLDRVPKGRGIASRLGLLSRVALTPEDMPLGEGLEAIRAAVADGVRLLNFSFHSPSVEPGHTPYVRDAADLAAFHHWWERVFALLAQLGVASASHDEILEAACGTPPPSANAVAAGGL